MVSLSLSSAAVLGSASATIMFIVNSNSVEFSGPRIVQKLSAVPSCHRNLFMLILSCKKIFF